MYIASDIYIADFAERAIILDLRRNRYSALKGAAADVVLSVLRGDFSRTIDMKCATQRQLVEDRILVHDRPTRHLDKAPPPQTALFPSLRFDRAMSQPLGLSGTAQALACLTRTAIILRLGSLQSLLSWLRNFERPSASPTDDEIVQKVVDSYYAARPFFPMKPICRLDAPALFLFLRKYGIPATLVLGVRLDPFVAHSWVQIGEAAIGEGHDRIRQYTPLLTV